MSHVVKMESRLTDVDAIEAAAVEMGGTVERNATGKLYDKSSHTGTVIRLPNWQYPVIVKADGELAYDDFHGHWGDKADLVRLKQEYGVAIIMRTQGRRWQISREQLDDGRLQVTLSQGGAR